MPHIAPRLFFNKLLMVVADALGDVLPLGPIVPIIRTGLRLTQPQTPGYRLELRLCASLAH